MNRIIIIGNVGQTPEMRYTASGQPVTNFNVAVNRRYNSAEGEPREDTTWFRVTAWNKTAELAHKYVSKGDKIAVEGRAELDQFTGQDGVARANIRVVASSIEFLTPSRNSQPQINQGPSQRPDYRMDDQTDYRDAIDDLPF